MAISHKAKSGALSLLLHQKEVWLGFGLSGGGWLLCQVVGMKALRGPGTSLLSLIFVDGWMGVSHTIWCSNF